MPPTSTSPRVQYRSTELETVPAVDRLLRGLGLGGFEEDSVTSVLGRNDNWSGRTDRGRRVFVKRLLDADRDRRLERSLHVERHAGSGLRTPRLLGADPAEALAAFEFLPDARTGAELALDEEMTDERCREAGALVAVLHSLPVGGFDDSPHPLPPVQGLEALSLAHWTVASQAELQMWGLLQRDAELVTALHALRSREPAGPGRTPVHGDLRLDQFLLSGDRLHLSDFEETRAGDPARDLGAFAGEWLFLAAAAIPVTLAGDLPLGRAADHAQVVATGTREVAARRPRVAAFCRGYLDVRPRALEDAGLLERATAFAGWHMLDRMLAAAAKANRLSPVTRAAAGIGRGLLISPAEFTSTLGLDVTP
ncbi:class V lanthionine synthetase subunit LxmK [Kineococcus rhizosphaerae]|uniref:Phosphotransferase family enzyme n=1 Tax=Kineococcus rhizosphaerae TaxID=559628 RepID=A0A2T0QYX5_9ACTN|nr:class V lanthionine synthetase subunit LxmK [Kineococcus rhizosphaerae]PRY11500.1 hypothetical protein CLV37_113124 [Kineococcus rhizosphaerae]